MNRIVYFVGAGPGEADLITVKGAKILGRAQAVLVDRLVSSDILQQYVPSHVKIIRVGKQGHYSPSMIQSEINELLISLIKQYPCIVRLKGGDTAFFSNIMDELAICKQHNIPYEIVPGITAASAASAYTGVPLTAREYATGVQFLSSCSYRKMSEIEWKCLAEMKKTLVWYMATKEWPHVAEKLILAGIDRKMPVLIIEQAATEKQYVHQFVLGDCIMEQNRVTFMSPTIIIIGKVAELYKDFSWYHPQSDRAPYFSSLEAHECIPQELK